MVAGLEAGDSFADAHDAARGFQSERGAGEPVFQDLFRQQRHRPHEVAEIEPARLDLDLDVARLWRNALEQRPAHTVEAAIDPARELRRHRFAVHAVARHISHANDAHGFDTVGPDRELGFRRSGQHRVCELGGCRVRINFGCDIGHMNLRAVQLVGERAHERPQSGVDRPEAVTPL